MLPKFKARCERLRRFAKGDNRDYTLKSPIESLLRLSETLDKLTSLTKGDKKDLALKDKFELIVKLSEILDRLKRLLIRFKISPICFCLRLRQTL